MALIPYVDESRASPEVRELLGWLPVKLNLFRIMAHADTSVKKVMGLGAAILARQKLDPLLRELAILHAMRLEHGEYEWVQHVPIAHDLGATQAQVAALEAGAIDAPCFDARQRATLAFATEVVRNVGASEAATRALLRHLDSQEVVELILALGFYSMMARLTESLQVEVDGGGGSEVAASLRRRAQGGQ